MKRALSLILALCMLAAFAGCSTSGTNAPADAPASQPADLEQIDGKTELETSTGAEATGSGEQSLVVVALTADPGTLDPFSSNSLGRLYSLQGMYETIGAYYNGKFNLVMAKELTSVEDDTLEYPAYDVTFWDCIYDSNGNHFTVDDYLWCMEQYREIGKNTTVKAVEKFEQTGDWTVRIYMNTDSLGKFEDFIRQTWLVTRKSYEASEDGMATTPVGTGAYKITEYKSGATIRYTTRDDYWQKDDSVKSAVQLANCNDYEIRIIKESNQIVIGLEAGEIDYASNLGYENSKRFMDGGSAAAGHYVDVFQNPGTEMLYLNCSTGSVFDNNPKLRQCVMHAIDIDSIINGVYSGYAMKAHDIACAINLADYPTQLDNEPYFEYDPELAASLLKEAGYEPGQLTLRLMTKQSDAFEMMYCQAIQQNLRDIGIEVEILGYENALYEQYKTNPNEWDIITDTRGEYNYFAFAWTKLDTNNYSSDVKSECFVDDDHLYELVATAASAKTTSEEAILAVRDYNNEMAYARGLCAPYRFDVINSNKIAVLTRGELLRFLPGATTYVWN